MKKALNLLAYIKIDKPAKKCWLRAKIFRIRMETKTERRSAIKKLIASIPALAGMGYVANAKIISQGEKTVGEVTEFQDVPLFSNHIVHDNLVYVAGRGAHEEGKDGVSFNIKSHTEIVLKELEKELVKAGSSMEKVLKVSVFLSDIADYKGMNEVYKGRFGKRPPVRTTVAVAKGGIPVGSLVEIDCIAYI